MALIYADHNATTPLSPRAREALRPYLESAFGNPSSVHRWGTEARYAVEKARRQVANLLGAGDPDAVVFASGGTESDNLAIQGVLTHPDCPGRHVITSAIEHPAVLETCRQMEARGWDLTVLPPDPDGLISPESLRRALRPDTALVSLMAANSETGAIQPIRELAAIARDHPAVFHTDAVQAVGRIPFSAEESGADLVTVSAHKLYGPQGAGALWVRPGTRLARIQHGGHQEGGWRAGTENVAAIAGFGAAAEEARERCEVEGKRLAGLRDGLQDRIVREIPDTLVVSGDAPRIPGVLNVCFRGVPGTYVVLRLNEQGIGVSTGSACSSGNTRPSHVLAAMGIPGDYLPGGVRISLGRGNTEADVERIAQALEEVVRDLREAPPVRDGGLSVGQDR